MSQKDIDSFSLFLSIVVHRREGNLSEKIKSLYFSKIGFQFIVIIKKHEEDWCAPVMEALADTMYHFTKAWNWGSRPILVLNEQMASDMGLIMPSRQSEK